VACFPVVPGGMVEEHRGPGGELHAHFHVVAVELAGALIAESSRRARARCPWKRRGSPAWTCRRTGRRLACAARTWRASSPSPRENACSRTGKARLDAPRVRRVGREAEDLADGEGGLPGGVLPPVMPDVEAGRSATFSAETWAGISLSPISDSRTRTSAVRAERGHELRGHLLGQLAESRGCPSPAGPVSRSRMSRIRAGSTNRSADGIGICMITKAATVVARPGLQSAWRLTTASAAEAAREGDRQHGISLTLGPHPASSSMFIEMSVSLADGFAVMSVR